MSRARGNVQRRVDLLEMSVSRIPNVLQVPNRTYSSSKTRCEWDPSNEPRHYGSPVRAVLVVAIAAVRIVHGVDVVQLLVHDPVVGEQDAGDGSELGMSAVEFRG
jgi:hypothetical protein